MRKPSASGPCAAGIRATRWCVRLATMGAVSIGSMFACGCADSGASSDALGREGAGLRASERTVQVTRSGETRQPQQPGSSAAPAAVIGGETYTIAHIAPYLAEGLGGLVIEEILITRAAEAELSRMGRSLTAADLERERAELADALDLGGGGVDPEQAIDSVRRARGLGPERFGLLVRRTAALRKLVSDEVSVTDEEIRLAHAVRFGPKRRVRMFMAASEREAAGALAELRGLDGSARRARFIQMAMDRSIDASGAAGGLIEPISAADPAYPLSVRTTIGSLPAGEISPVIALNPNYAIVLVEEVIADQGVPIESVRASLASDLRRRQERLLMERKARAILETSSVTIIDPSLQWSWRSRESRREQ